ncbi:hypothetical protein GW17_00042526, partial [Ensete ventricosum]
MPLPSSTTESVPSQGKSLGSTTSEFAKTTERTNMLEICAAEQVLHSHLEHRVLSHLLPCVGLAAHERWTDHIDGHSLSPQTMTKACVTSSWTHLWMSDERRTPVARDMEQECSKDESSKASL